MNLPESRNASLPHSIGIGRSSMEGCGGREPAGQRDGSMNRRRSDETLHQFAVCNVEVTEQVQKQLEGKYIPPRQLSLCLRG